MKENIIIIGAGPAGLACGYELIKKDKNIEISVRVFTDDLEKTIKKNYNSTKEQGKYYR